jgi:hypothetical protein
MTLFTGINVTDFMNVGSDLQFQNDGNQNHHTKNISEHFCQDVCFSIQGKFFGLI